MRKITESQLDRMVSLLTGGTKVKVIFKAGVAETMGNTIVLPALPDNASEDLTDAMLGYLTQQTGHVLYGDSRIHERAKSDSLVWSAFSLLEDLRVERAIERIYPGAKASHDDTHAWVFSKLKSRWEEFSPLLKTLYLLFLDVAHPGSEFAKDHLTDELQEKLDIAREVYDDHTLDSSADVLACAEEIVEKLREEEEESEEGEEENEDQDGESEEGEEENEDQDGESEEESDEDGSDESDEGSESSSEGTSPSESDNGEEAAEEDSQEGSGSSGDGEEDEDEATYSDARVELSDLLEEAAEEEVENGVPQFYGQQPYEHGLDDGEAYTIYTTAYDLIEDAETDYRYKPNLQALRERSKPLVSKMKQKLINSLRTHIRRKWQGGKQDGKLDARRAYKAVFLGATDVYKRRTKKMTLDTAVALAIDHSGSMHGPRLNLAASSALVLGDVFHPLKVPFLVYGYSTQGMPHAIPGADRYKYARWSNLWIQHYKRFDESWDSGSLKLAKAPDNCQANTLDGESVLYGIRQLLARPEKRKVLLVFNDGAPYPGYGNVGRSQAYLKSIVEAGQAAGVEIIAFGIGTEAVKHYYPNYVVVSQLDDLVKEPLKKMDAILREGLK